MRRLIIILSFLSLNLFAQEEKSALLLIDIQEFYFPGGFSELARPEKAAINAAMILETYRKDQQDVIHIQHATQKQMDINKNVAALDNEKRFVKKEINSFNGTQLRSYLDSLGINHLTIVGMQTHMCVEAAVRAAYDFGFKVTLIEDACATKDLKWEDTVVPAEQVHKSTLSTLKNYAEILTTNEYLNR